MSTRSMRGFAALAAVVALLAGCASKVSGPAAESGAPPASFVIATSPVNLAKAIANDWNGLDWKHYSDRLTDDFEFQFSDVDSAGNAFRYRVLGRNLEIEAARRMLETGAGTLPPFRTVLWTFSPTLVPQTDPRPGKTFPFHQLIRAGMNFSADAGFTVFRITGSADFYVVRGDSAQIPAELVARGFKPDPNQWWLERWDDLTLGDAPSAVASAGPADPLTTLPSRSYTFGSLKALYLAPPTASPSAGARTDR